jgi:hypothetical protein
VQNENVCTVNTEMAESESMKLLNERCTKFYLKLVTLRGFDRDIVEELFFNNLVGAVQIDKILPFILNMNSNNNNNNDANVSKCKFYEQYIKTITNGLCLLF